MLPSDIIKHLCAIQKPMKASILPKKYSKTDWKIQSMVIFKPEFQEKCKDKDGR